MTTFKGRTAFNKGGKANAAAPNATGAPTTKFCGRPAVPAGPLKRYPGSVADTSGGNRRLSKSNHGDGGGSGTRFSSRTAFGKGGK